MTEMMDPALDPTADDDCGLIDANFDDTLMDLLVTFAAEACGQMDGLCTYGLTIGETYVPFDPDEEDECPHGENRWECSEGWVRVVGIVPTGTVEGMNGQCVASLRITLEVGVLRCFPTPDNGEAPSASDVFLGVEQSMTDMTTMYRGAMRTQPQWDALSAGQWRPMGPAGLQYGGQWTFTADLG